MLLLKLGLIQTLSRLCSLRQDFGRNADWLLGQCQRIWLAVEINRSWKRLFLAWLIAVENLLEWSAVSGDWEGFCSRLFFSSYCFTILSSHVWKISILKNMPRKWFWLVDSAYVNQSKKWAVDVSWKVCIRLSFRFAFTAVHKAKRKGSRISGYTLAGDGLRLPFYPFTLEIVSKYMRWNPFNTVTNGSKNLAVLTPWPYYRGRLKFHDLTAVMTNTPYIAVAFLEQLFSLINNRSVDIAYSNKKNYSLHFPFSTKNTSLVKFGYKIATSALYVYCSLKTIQA